MGPTLNNRKFVNNLAVSHVGESTMSLTLPVCGLARQNLTFFTIIVLATLGINSTFMQAPIKAALSRIRSSRQS